jgi:hypothetical protein
MEYYLAEKNEILSFAVKWMELVMLPEISQTPLWKFKKLT